MIETQTWLQRGLPLLLCAASALAACGDGPTAPEPIEETTFVDALGIDLDDFTRLESGVYIKDVVVGEGPEAVDGTRAQLVIEGWLPTGVPFQAVMEFSFTLGADQVIPGFEIGVSGMREGGTRVFIVPAELGYGTDVLVFEVDLVAVTVPEEGGASSSSP